ncbi:MAG: 6-phosphogluconolactonase [Chloroflexota bacterium]
MSRPNVIVVADASAAAQAGADHIAEALSSAVDARGRADWVTTGGSSPTGIYRLLASEPLVDTVPWPRVHVWWTDERFVPRDHPLSNAKPFDDILLKSARGEKGPLWDAGTRVTIPFDQVHPFRTAETIGAGGTAADCARELAAELAAADLPRADGWPVFDLMLIGVGRDGHLMSVFPGSAAFDVPELALAIPAPTHIEPHVERVTLNPAIVGAARDVLVVATGSDKAAAIGKAFAQAGDPKALPARVAVREGATWIIDEAAAAELPRP